MFLLWVYKLLQHVILPSFSLMSLLWFIAWLLYMWILKVDTLLIQHACFLSICFKKFVCAYMKPRDIDITLTYHLFFLMFCFNLLFVCTMLSIGPLSSSIFLHALFQDMLHKLWSWNQFTNFTNQVVGVLFLRFMNSLKAINHIVVHWYSLVHKFSCHQDLKPICVVGDLQMGRWKNWWPRKGNMFSSSSFGSIVLPIVHIHCMGIILLGYCLGYGHILPNKTPIHPICFNNNLRVKSLPYYTPFIHS